MATYRIHIDSHRGTREISAERCNTLHRATLLFMAAARAHHATNDNCVLLVRLAKHENGGTVLAHKSTDSDRVVFEPAYWRE